MPHHGPLDDDRPLTPRRILGMRERYLKLGKHCEACGDLPSRRTAPRCVVCRKGPGPDIDRTPKPSLFGSMLGQVK